MDINIFAQCVPSSANFSDLASRPDEKYWNFLRDFGIKFLKSKTDSIQFKLLQNIYRDDISWGELHNSLVIPNEILLG